MEYGNGIRATCVHMFDKVRWLDWLPGASALGHLKRPRQPRQHQRYQTALFEYDDYLVT
jgi:hypothetical protein